MFENYGKMFVMLLALGVAGQVLGMAKKKPLNKKKFELISAENENASESENGAEKEKNKPSKKLKESQKITVLKDNLKKRVWEVEKVPSILLCKDAYGNVYVKLGKIWGWKIFSYLSLFTRSRQS